MKKMFAILLALMLALGGSLTAMAEGGSTDQPPQMGRDGMTPPEMPDGTMPGNPPDGAPGGFGGGTPPGGGTPSFEYSAATEITATDEQTDQTYASKTADESALIVNTADAVSIINPTVTKTGDSDGGDNCNFYGLNAGLLVMGGSTTTITGGSVETSASGANGGCHSWQRYRFGQGQTGH